MGPSETTPPATKESTQAEPQVRTVTQPDGLRQTAIGAQSLGAVAQPQLRTFVGKGTLVRSRIRSRMAAAKSSSCRTFPHWFSGLLVVKIMGRFLRCRTLTTWNSTLAASGP